ncbi:hypothetical protein [Pseudothauera rhizosphaerae]|uniref:Uncharacterized protein n=1 Tax=Pseudothauera rhizosphaerae TaxID=2565932 RepID=A0A4S4AFY1_9RHOO|nr:hypothetical protein [Pseudothauera rhizosphaerae]THF58106.1 hypothetical protein E6O51_17345 [Pseudothauera rhizosphaerae]
MSCNQGSQDGSLGALGDVSSSALDGFDAFIDDQKSKGMDPSIIGKIGGPVGKINKTNVPDPFASFASVPLSPLLLEVIRPPARLDIYKAPSHLTCDPRLFVTFLI